MIIKKFDFLHKRQKAIDLLLYYRACCVTMIIIIITIIMIFYQLKAVDFVAESRSIKFVSIVS